MTFQFTGLPVFEANHCGGAVKLLFDLKNELKVKRFKKMSSSKSDRCIDKRRARLTEFHPRVGGNWTYIPSWYVIIIIKSRTP